MQSRLAESCHSRVAPRYHLLPVMSIPLYLAGWRDSQKTLIGARRAGKEASQDKDEVVDGVSN
jgi:hypothetical protein